MLTDRPTPPPDVSQDPYSRLQKLAAAGERELSGGWGQTWRPPSDASASPFSTVDVPCCSLLSSFSPGDDASALENSAQQLKSELLSSAPSRAEVFEFTKLEQVAALVVLSDQMRAIAAEAVAVVPAAIDDAIASHEDLVDGRIDVDTHEEKVGEASAMVSVRTLEVQMIGPFISLTRARIALLSDAGFKEEYLSGVLPEEMEEALTLYASSHPEPGLEYLLARSQTAPL